MRSRELVSRVEGGGGGGESGDRMLVYWPKGKREGAREERHGARARPGRSVRPPFQPPPSLPHLKAATRLSMKAGRRRWHSFRYLEGEGGGEGMHVRERAGGRETLSIMT